MLSMELYIDDVLAYITSYHKNYCSFCNDDIADLRAKCGALKMPSFQSIMFDKSKWTISQAREWLRKHEYKSGKVDSSGEFHRFRQYPPPYLENPKTVSLGKVSRGIKGIYHTK